MRIVAAALLLVFASAQSNDLPVEQTKKNIKVLQGLPSSQLIPVMAFMSNSLGVTCGQCHVKEWESDEKPAKETARKMIAMERDINTRNFDGKTVVTCNSCHQGHILPNGVPSVANSGWNRAAAPPVLCRPPIHFWRDYQISQPSPRALSPGPSNATTAATIRNQDRSR
jgi:hypothetical protein